MAWVDTIPTWEDWTANENDNGEVVFTTKHQVIFDSNSDGPGSALYLAPDVPQYKSQYAHGNEWHTYAFCNSRSVSPRNALSNGRIMYEVTCTFSTAVSAFENPLDEPWRITGSFAQFQRLMEYDVNNQAVVNSAGFPYQDATEKDDSRPVLSVQRNEPHPFNFTLAYFLRDKVNNSYVGGFGPNTIKIQNISFDGPFFFQTPFGQIIYWDVKYDFAMNEEGWGKYILDAGYQAYFNGEIKHILDANGQPISSPYCLDGNGGLGDPSSPQFRFYQPYYGVSFSLLNIF